MQEETETQAVIVRGFVKGMLFAVALTVLNVALEHTPFGERLGWYACEELSGWIEPRESPITVVDITDVPPIIREGQQVTSREALREIVFSLAREGATAIGVDVDLAPEDGQPLDPEDARFLEDMLALREGKAGLPATPVLVGIHRSLGQAVNAHLGDPRFEPLAATLLVRESRIPTVPAWIAPDAGRPQLFGLGAALVRARNGDLPAEPSAWRWLRRANVEGHGEHLRLAALLVDTKPIDELVRNRIRVRPSKERGGSLAERIRESLEAEREAGRSARGRIVLLGAADPEDRIDNAFFVPGEERPYPGVYMHACAAHTILQGYLYWVTPLGRTVADLVLAVLVFGGIALARLLYARRRAGPAPHFLIFLILLALSLVLAVAGGLVGIARYRLIWDGFVYVGIAAFLHLFIEAWLHAGAGRHDAAPRTVAVPLSSNQGRR